MFLTNHSSPFLLHDVRVVKNVACLSSLLNGETRTHPLTANVERQLERQAMDAPNCFLSVIAFGWSYKVKVS